MPTSEGAAFAARRGCLFVKASAKVAEVVTEAFNEVAARIIDAPSLWNEDKPKSSGRMTATATPPPLVDHAVPQPRVCRGILICPRCRTKRYVGRVFVLAVRRFFF